MNMTVEQEAVVSITSGRHLVLAPPGSGKTEMLSRRILAAVKSGVDPSRMLCATFTNRAAYEMRERVSSDASELPVPDVGNLHHFCHSFLVSAGCVHPGKHVLDEVQQLEFIHEIVDVLRFELRNPDAIDERRTRGVSVLRMMRGVCECSPDDSMRQGGALNRGRISDLRNLLESHIAKTFENERNPYSEILSGVLTVLQRKAGIPPQLVRSAPHAVSELMSKGVIDAVAHAYKGLKRKFACIDFDDLLNETYLFLETHPLSEDKRYIWVQIDEVQDLSPLQWSIVKSVTASTGVSVFFGDFEQAIFSFLGASTENFAMETSDCVRHYFRKNFRATPLLLEILMRYSLEVLHSSWEFLPEPSDVNAKNGVMELSEEKLELGKSGIDGDFDFRPLISRVKELLSSGITENVAILVRTNKAADLCEKHFKRLGYRYAKVSGADLFSFGPMRDFLAFVSLFTSEVSKTAWAALVRRFSGTVRSSTSARYFVRSMFASGWNPRRLFDKNDPVGLVPSLSTRSGRWAWVHRRGLLNLRNALLPAWKALNSAIDGKFSFREIFRIFFETAFGEYRFYETGELFSNAGTREDNGIEKEVSFERGVEHAKERIEKFLRYMDHVYADDDRPFRKILKEDWRCISTLKEADLLVGDEKIVISTIHKAKGRQFDAVCIPDVRDVVDFPLADPDEARRLLYVAMSRAKRHLLLWEAGDASIESLRPCFAERYDGYYVRRRNGTDLSDDWLWRWEKLADQNMRRICDAKTVLDALQGENIPVACMAMKVFRWSQDISLSRSVYLRMVANGRNPSLVETALRCLTECAIFDQEAADTVRCAAVRNGCACVERASLDYFVRMMSSGNDVSILFFVPFLYSRNPSIRSKAADHLAGFGDLRWTKVVTGAKADFERLARTRAPEHEGMIRQILDSRHLPSGYEKALRNIILKRAIN